MSHENISTSFNRRRFLTASAIAGAGLVLAPRGLNAQNANVSSNRKLGDPINVAIVGCGAQGSVLLESIRAIVQEQRNPIGIRLVAACDIWDYRLQPTVRRLALNGIEGVKPYNDFTEMLDKEGGNVDAVFVATPDLWHAPHTNAALKAGKHVYCEKMMARTADEARSMVRTMKETGKLLQIGHQRRSNPNYIYAVNRLIRQNKVLGRITNANGQWNRGVKPDEKLPPNKKTWIADSVLKQYGYEDAHQFLNWRWFKKYSGGPISDLGAHQIDTFNWVLGRPRSVLAGGGVDYYKDHEWYDNVMCIFDYETPEGVARAYYQVLTTTSSGGGYFENFMGIDGSLKISEQPSNIKVYGEDSAKAKWAKYADEGLVKPDTTPVAKKPASDTVEDTRTTAPVEAFDLPTSTGKKYIHQFHVENFLKAIKGEAKLNCDAAEAFEAEAPIFRVNEAVAAEKMIRYTEADFTV